MTSEVQTKHSVQVGLPNGEFKALRVVVNFGCQAVASADLNVFADEISEKNESPQQRRVIQADNETPLPGGKTSKWRSRFNLRGSWMVVLHFLVLPNMACPHTLSGTYLGT